MEIVINKDNKKIASVVLLKDKDNYFLIEKHNIKNVFHELENKNNRLINKIEIDLN